MKKLLLLKHWQLFILLMLTPVVFQIIMAATLLISNDPMLMFKLFPIMMLLFMAIFFGWFYALGTNLHKKLPESVIMNLTLFKIFLFIPVLYMSFFMLFVMNMFSMISTGKEPNLAIMMLIFPLHLFSMFCIFFCLYFNAKALKAVELQRAVKFDDFVGEFFLLWFFPVGIWILQPRINKLFDDTLNNAALSDGGTNNVATAYNNWSSQYDTNLNKTRDLEAQTLRTTLANISFERCLEIGCGTGKNTVWFNEKAAHTTSVDLSEEMLSKAKEKITSDKVNFIQADITKEWSFTDGRYDLVSFSLVLEHIEDLDFIFKNVSQVLQKDGYVYIGELHPFKQYTGSKARFETDKGTQVVTCFTHAVSEFVQTAKKHGLQLIDLNEYLDDDNSTKIPRILTLLLRKE